MVAVREIQVWIYQQLHMLTSGLKKATMVKKMPIACQHLNSSKR